MNRCMIGLIGFLLAAAVAAGGGESATPSPYWKNEVSVPSDPFIKRGSFMDDPGWVKFTILTSAPATIYFQDCTHYAFHYDFATELLDPFVGMSPAEYDQISLYAQGQQAILGAVVVPPQLIGYPPPPQIPEYGIQFVRRDPYTKEQIRDLFNVVKANIVTSPGVQAFYFPAYEQLAVAEANRDWFDSQGIPVSSTARWEQSNPIYSDGWALGGLKFFPGNEIEAAFFRGDLRTSDVLLTDGVPADVPVVAGIISLAPATPNSHVALLAESYDLPFVHLAVAEDATRAQSLVGRQIVVRATTDRNGVEDVRLIDASMMTAQQVEELFALKAPPPLSIMPVEPLGSYSLSTDGLLPSDISYFGGKAANFGILRTSIPDNSPVACAFSFDLWNAFLDQPLPVTSNTLRQEITTRLAGFSYPPADMQQLATALEGVRDLIEDDERTFFLQELRDAVIATLVDPQYEFDSMKNIRFRSSTNVEDSEQFIGAGFYGSYSGCLADDLDANDSGPSICDPTESNERGVFRAIRKVFASFYGYNAFLERRRFSIDENQVGMAILVHEAFPDVIELANGVATLEKGIASSSYRTLTVVTQLGAVSVTNPDSGAIPEEVSVRADSSVFPMLVRPSSLVPLGGTVMHWDSDYRDLTNLLLTAADRFAEITSKTTYLLDFEFKKLAPNGKLIVKQIREVPREDDEQEISPFLIDDGTVCVIHQGEVLSENRTVFSAHRLKSFWRFRALTGWVTSAAFRDRIYEDIQLEYLGERGKVKHLTGSPTLWPDASHSSETVSGPWGVVQTIDSWQITHWSGPSRWELIAKMPDRVSRTQPVLTLHDLANKELSNSSLNLRVEYTNPVRAGDSSWNPGATTLEDVARLWPVQGPHPKDTLQTRSFADASEGSSITTTFYWPPEPTGAVAGYTAPVKSWVETVIEGYTAEPIVLHGYYSQTYGPMHHNFSEHFLFEPRLEPGISPSILQQLGARNIRLIHLFYDGIGPNPFIETYGFERGMTAADRRWMLYE